MDHQLPEWRDHLKVLAIDIETRPGKGYFWRIFDENIGIDQIIDPGGVICFAAKWVGIPGVEFYSDFHDGHETTIIRAHEMLDEADAVLHYNGARFDIPHLQREFMEAGMKPPSPFKQIDLLRTMKKEAKFISNKLAFVAPRFGLRGKLQHEGFALWVKCMEGDERAWKRMQKYNIRDVTELEKLYMKARPWIRSHPSIAAFTGENVCPKCGSPKLQRRGYAVLSTGKYPRLHCQGCGAWSRGTKRVNATEVVQLSH